MTPRRLLRIARWEVTKSLGTVDRRAALVVGVAIVVAALVAPFLVGAGGTLDDGIYRVAVDDDHEYAPAIEQRASLRAVSPDSDADLVVAESGVMVDETPKSQAALTELREAIEQYNVDRLAAEDDREAAFPVVVEVRYESRPTTLVTGGLDEASTDDEPDPDDPTPDDDTATADADDTDDREPVEDDDDPSDAESDDPGEEDTSDPTDDAERDDEIDDEESPMAEPDDETATDGSFLPIPGIGGPELAAGSEVNTPSSISPPFPFGALVLAFLFVIPMNFVIQAYGSTIMDERLNRRGELLLVSPASRLDIVGGKTLPYLGVLIAVTALIALLVGGGVVAVLSVLPIALLFLAATFVGAMFARSYKELTFVTVTVSVVLTTYVFVPAIFTEVTPVALISPLTLVVFELQGESISAIQYIFSTSPFYLASAVLFGLGIGIYREEDMFTQRPVHLKALDALAAHVYRYRHVAAMSALLIPFVFVVELLAIAVLFVLPLSLSLPVLLLTISVVEEIAKSVHVFAGFAHERFDRTVPVAVAVGAASGIGFFVAEKATHVTQLVGLHELDLGRIAFATGTDATPAVAAVLFFAPLVLHVTTAVISSLGARIDGRRYAVGLLIAVFVHTVYNLGVIALVG